MAPASAAPLDDWLAGVADRDLVVVVPRIDRVAGPLSAAVDRLATHPTLGELSAGVREALAWPTDLAEHVRLGLAAEGPLVFASGPVAFLPVPDASNDARYLETIGLEGRTRRLGGMLVVAPTDAALDALTSAKSTADPLADCPREKGQAELFVRWTMTGVGRVCVALRTDPGRIRLDARVVFAPAQPLADWVGKPDPTLVDYLGPKVTTVLAVSLGTAALDRLAKESGVAGGLLSGGIVVGAGPEPDSVTIVLRTTDPKRLRVVIDAALAAQTLAQVAKVDDGWVIQLDGREARGRLEGDVLILTTLAQPKGDYRAGLTGPARLDGELLRNAPFTWFLRLSGAPHDGRPFVDAVGPNLAALGVRPDGLEGIASAIAYAIAHVSEIGFAVRVDGDALVAALEVVTL